MLGGDSIFIVLVEKLYVGDADHSTEQHTTFDSTLCAPSMGN